MKYTGWSKAEMIGELVLRGVSITRERAQKADKHELTRLLHKSEADADSEVKA